MSRSLRELYESSPFSSAQAPYLEAQYERFLSDPAAVAPELRQFFSQLGAESRTAKRRTVVRALPGREAAAASPAMDGEKQSAVSRLIQFYANRGHLIADIDPLGLMQRPLPPVLDPRVRT